MVLAAVCIAFGIYVPMGLLLVASLDNSRRYRGFIDRLSPARELATWLLWPVAIPYLCRRHAKRDPRLGSA